MGARWGVTSKSMTRFPGQIFKIVPGYFATRSSEVTNAIPSDFAWATRISTKRIFVNWFKFGERNCVGARDKQLFVSVIREAASQRPCVRLKIFPA